MPSSIVRAIHFIWRRFAVDALGVVIMTITVDLLTQKALGEGAPRLSLVTAVTVTTSLLFHLLLRIIDDIRDVSADRVFGAERPVAAGAISVRELRVLAALSVGAVCALNSVFDFARAEALAVLVSLYLISKWFFLPKVFATSEFRSMLANCTFFFLSFLYVADATSRAHGWLEPAWPRYAIAGLMLLPLFSYELARKTFAPENEKPGYPSYSRSLGHRPAAYLGLGFAVLHAVLVFAFTEKLKFSDGARVVIWGLALLYLDSTFWFAYYDFRKRFSIFPPKNRNKLDLFSAAYLVGANVFLTLGALGVF